MTVWCRKTASQTVAVRTLIKTNGVLFAGASNFDCPNSGTYGSTATTYTVNPQTSGAWNQGQIDALQAGCRDNDATTREVRCSEVRIDVNHNSRQALEVWFAFSGVPLAGDRWALVVECKYLVQGGGGENVLVQVGQGGNPPSSWNTAYTCVSNLDTLFTTYFLTTTELNNGAPVIRLWDNQGPTDTVQGTMDLDVFRIDRTASPPTQVGSDIRFWDDFEGGSKKWLPFADPATNSFGTIPGSGSTGEVRQSWFFKSRNVLSMVSRSSSPGVAYGLSSLFAQSPAYIVLTHFSVSDVAAPLDTELPGTFTVYDDGYVRLGIDGYGPLTDPGGRLVSYQPIVPPVPAFIQVLQFNVWYVLDIRVYPADGLYQLFINEVYKGAFALVSTTPRGMALLGDDSYVTGTSGVASWDNLVVATLRTPPFTENFDDGSVTDWVQENTPFNTFAVSTDNGPPTPPYGLKARDASSGTAYGYSPYIDLDAPLAALPDYKTSFKFFVPSGTTPQGLIVVSDGAAHLLAVNHDASSFDLKAYVSSVDSRQVGQVSKAAWHTLIAEVHRNAAPTPNYDVWIDGTKAVTGPFPFVGDARYRKAPSDLVLGDHTYGGTGGEAFWDDFSVTFGTIGPPTVTICNGGVSPSSGVRVTQTFTYCVIYRDPSNNPPRGGAPLVLLKNTDPRLKPVVPDTDNLMNLDFFLGPSGDWVTGAQFSYSRTWFFPSTLYTYKFHANDGFGNYVETPTFSGPTVTGCNPPFWVATSVSPTKGFDGKTVFTWEGTLWDFDDDSYSTTLGASPRYIAVVIDGVERTVSQIDPLDTHTNDGKLYFRSATLSTGVHDFKFRAVDTTCATFETSLISLPKVDPSIVSPCNDEWVTFHHDMARTGASDCIGPATSNVEWGGRADGSSSESSPVAADRSTGDLMFIGRNDAVLSYATTGARQWTQSLSIDTQTPTLAEGMVIIGDQYGIVRAYSEAGTLRWSHDTNQYNPQCDPAVAKIEGSVGVAAGLVFVSVGNRGVFVALNLMTGALAWRFNLPDCGDFTSSPTIYKGRVFVPATIYTPQVQANLYALPLNDPNGDGVITPNPDPALSELIWTFTLPELDVDRRYILSTPTVYEDVVFFGAEDGIVWALPVYETTTPIDKIRGEPDKRWLYETWTAWGLPSRTIGDRVRSSPAVHDKPNLYTGSLQKAVFVGARDMVLAIDRETGALIWSKALSIFNVGVGGSPAVAYGFVYIRHVDKLYSLNEVVAVPPTGEKNWERQVANGAGTRCSSPAIFDGRLFIGGAPVGSNDYHVWAIKDP